MSYKDRTDEDDATVTFPAIIMATTRDALLVQNEDANEEQWIPRSCVPAGDDFTDSDVDESLPDFEMAEWKARELGWTD